MRLNAGFNTYFDNSFSCSLNSLSFSASWEVFPLVEGYGTKEAVLSRAGPFFLEELGGVVRALSLEVGPEVSAEAT